MSDLHFEFHADRGRSFVGRLDPAGVDALILAGDITVAADLVDALTWFCERFPYVFYVMGNHELYGYSRTMAEQELRRAAGLNRNLFVLDGTTVHGLDGRRFLGCALWFPHHPSNQQYEHLLNDFALIPRFRSWVYDTNLKHAAWLRGNVREGDVVVTHHLPSERSIAARFRGSELNRFFVSPMEDVLARRPGLWVHGHTHEPADYVHPSGTRVVCNPFGYVGSERNERFDDRLIVDV